MIFKQLIQFNNPYSLDSNPKYRYKDPYGKPGWATDLETKWQHAVDWGISTDVFTGGGVSGEIVEDTGEEVVEKGQLKYPLDKNTIDLLRNFISDEIFDLIWNGQFYLYSHFEGDDGWGVVDIVGGAGCDSEGITLQSEASLGSANLNNPPTNIGEVFNSEIRFRSLFSLPSVEDVKFSFSIGESPYKHFGFFVEQTDGQKGTGKSFLYGTISENDDTTDSGEKVLLAEIEDNKFYDIEARFFPKERIEFYIGDGHSFPIISGDEEETILPELKATISTPKKIPSGSLISDNTWIKIEVESEDASLKQAKVSFLEYIQRKIKKAI